MIAANIAKEYVYRRIVEAVAGLYARLYVYIHARTQVTNYKYLNQKRIAHAKKLLVDKNYSVLEVALQCGFSNLSSFLRMFKQLTGCTPTELRRMYDGNFDYV